ncbi:MAG TPA: hypothetical protein VFF30_15425 [Nitrososphaerales archaeon]|nr:hypothetical protein [Nitrososphaerales archaeon]
MKKNVEAQEDKLGEALKTFNQLGEDQIKSSQEGDSGVNAVLWESLNTSITILGDLVSSYRKYTEELEKSASAQPRRRTRKAVAAASVAEQPKGEAVAEKESMASVE